MGWTQVYVQRPTIRGKILDTKERKGNLVSMQGVCIQVPMANAKQDVRILKPPDLPDISHSRKEQPQEPASEVEGMNIQECKCSVVMITASEDVDMVPVGITWFCSYSWPLRGLPSPTSFEFLMTVLSWNVRGALGKEFGCVSFTVNFPQPCPMILEVEHWTGLCSPTFKFLSLG